ncbi:MAG: hypothetical protein ACFB9M_02205 [Myxococcota bacterium]
MGLPRLSEWQKRWRRFVRPRLPPDVSIYYDPGYTIRLAGLRTGHVQLRRGDNVVGRLQHDGILEAEDITSPQPVSVKALSSFHPWSYIDASAEPETLSRIFGLDRSMVDVEAMLNAVRIAVGGTVEAAQGVVWGDKRCAFNMGGGFHHAEPELGSGFCVFNDIGVAVQVLREKGFDAPILIVDLDVHQGNGNSVAFTAADRVRVYSIHGSVWSHVERKDHKEIHLRGAVNDRRYLACLRTTLLPMARRMRPKLIFFIAGADVLAQDRLGTFWMSIAGVFERDRIVHELADELKAGLVVTMGGGYSPSSWLTYYNFTRFVVTGRPRVVEDPGNVVRKSFDEIASQLEATELQQSDDDLIFDFHPDELFGELSGQSQSRRFLGFYSKHGVEIVLERYGLNDQVRRRGYSEVDVQLEVDDPSRQVLRVRGLRHGRWYLLVEMIGRKRNIQIRNQTFKCLHTDWLLMQDPNAHFTLDRPRLPGQEHPGLGVARYATELLIRSCVRLGLAGVSNNPSHFHNGIAGSSEFRFLDPELEGRTRALAMSLSDFSISDASFAMEEERVKTEDGETVKWIPGDQVLPVSQEMKDAFLSEEYVHKMEESTKSWLRRGIHIETSETIASAESTQ